MARTPDSKVPSFCGLVAFSIASGCTLTGPLDGYAEGEPPSIVDAGGDASLDVVGDPSLDGDTHCPPGFADCDGNASNGCEVELATDLSHCGACDNPCSIPNGLGACIDGMCTIASCFDGFDNCDDDTETGCETDLSDDLNCGFCSNACEYDHAEAICTSSGCLMGDCLEGFEDCDGEEANGCEENTLASVEHCGSCGNVCSVRPNSSPACEEGNCALACDQGYADCDGDFANGCETILESDVNHCGACGSACSTNHAIPECVSGSCELTCEENYDDCDLDVGNGCEADLLADPDHCSGCGLGCTSPDGAVPTCVVGACGFDCLPGLGDCNGNTADGCETDVLTHPLHCGACGRSCHGGSCVDGKCPVLELASGLNRPSGIVLDADWVYWTDAYDKEVYRVNKAGGARQSVVVGGATGPITRHGSTLFWATGANISRIGTDGTNQQIVVGGESLIVDLTNDGTNLFWLRPGTWSGSQYNQDGVVVRVGMSGGSVTELAKDQRRPKALAVDATHVYWVNEGTYTGATYNNDGSLLRVSKTGGATTTLALQQDKPCGVAVDDTSIYWANCGSGVVMVLEKSGGGRELLTGQNISDGLRLVGKHLFWPYLGADPNMPTGDLRRGSILHSNVLVLSDEQLQPFRLDVDANYVYWLNQGGAGDLPPSNGSVMRVPR